MLLSVFTVSLFFACEEVPVPPANVVDPGLLVVDDCPLNVLVVPLLPIVDDCPLNVLVVPLLPIVDDDNDGILIVGDLTPKV